MQKVKITTIVTVIGLQDTKFYPIQEIISAFSLQKNTETQSIKFYSSISKTSLNALLKVSLGKAPIAI